MQAWIKEMSAISRVPQRVVNVFLDSSVAARRMRQRGRGIAGGLDAAAQR